MRYIILLTLGLFVLSTQAQPEALDKFVPQGYSILDFAQGDLNRDSLPDYVLILRNNLDTLNDAPDSVLNRPLLIIHGQKNKTLKLIARNDNVVLCLTCGGVFGDPYGEIVITKNYFSIEHMGGSSWRWTKIITFKYNLSTKQYVLHKDAGESYRTTEPDKSEQQGFNQPLWDKQLFINYKSDNY